MTDMEETYTIAQVARRSGFSIPTLRYYESEGIIPPVPRDWSGNRVYGTEEISRVDTIRCLRASGLTLHEMRRYFDLLEEGDVTTAQRRSLLIDARARLLEQAGELEKCLEYLSMKIGYYNASCEALSRGEAPPDFDSEQFCAVFAKTASDSDAR